MPDQAVVYDACVLYPAALRSLLMYLAAERVYRARWTARIHDEWTRNVLANHPDIRPDRLRRTRDLMDAHVPDCLVVGYEPLIDTLTLPDPDDRHVLAAAVTAKAAVIVTSNLRDFPVAALAPYGITPRTPDAFVTDVLAERPAAVCTAFANQRQELRRPPKTVDELLADLERCGLRATVAALRPFADQL